MANRKHLKTLKSGVLSWNQWRLENGVVLYDENYANKILTELPASANISSANLSNSDLAGINLFMANANKTDFSDAKLSNSDFQHANLSRADFTNANLKGALLNGANLTKAKFVGTDLTDVDFSEAIFINTIFGLTDLSSCKNLENINVFGSCIIDFFTLRKSKDLPKAFLTKIGIPHLLMKCLPDFYNPSLMIYPAFLSHSWADKEFVHKLYNALTENGVTIWLDEKKMKPGDNIHDSITEGIKYYDKLILVCSENSLNSWWVEKELEKVYEKEREMQKKRGKKFRLVIPIRIDDQILDCKEGILTTVRNSMIGDFTKWQDETKFEKALNELLDALSANRLDIKPPSFL